MENIGQLDIIADQVEKATRKTVTGGVKAPYRDGVMVGIHTNPALNRKNMERAKPLVEEVIHPDVQVGIVVVEEKRWPRYAYTFTSKKES